MGQKINPIIYRISNKKSWSSNFMDIRLRTYLNNLFGNYNFITKKYPYLNSLYISTTVTPLSVNFDTTTKRSSIIKHIQLITGYKNITLELLPAKTCKTIPIFSASLLAKYIVNMLETTNRGKLALKRILYALKENSIGYAIKISGRINGVDMARHKIYSRGKLPLQSISSNIDYSYRAAHTKFGIIGIKVWLNKLN